MSLLALLTTLATTLTIGPAFTDNGWLAGPVVAIGTAFLVGAVWRWWRPGSPFTALVQLVVVLLIVAAVYAGDYSIARIVPTPETLQALVDLVLRGASTAQHKIAPVASTAGTSLIIALLVGPVAIVVDDCAVQRRPALAGLPLLALFAMGTAVVRVSMSAWSVAWPLLGYLVLLWADQMFNRLAWRPQRAGVLLSGTLGAVIIGGIVTVIGLLVPAFFSLPDGGAFHTNGGERSPGIKIARSTDLGGQLKQPTPIELFTVSTTDKDPYYLRTAVLDEWTPEGWKMPPPKASGVPLDNLPGATPGIATVDSTTKVTIQAYADSFVPTYADTTSIKIDGKYEYDASGSVLFSKTDTLSNEQYIFDSERPEPTAEQLAAAGTNVPSAIGTRDLQMPGNVTDLVSTLVNELTSGASTNYAKALALQTFFDDPSSGFQYSFDVPKGNSGDKLTDFLINRRGFCEQYASAMAGMLRVAGVPSRVVVGYTRGAEETNGEHQITTSDAHAWVEAYFDGVGWVPFDPTPIGSRGQPQSYEASQQPDGPQAPTGPTPNAPAANGGASASGSSSSDSSSQQATGHAVSSAAISPSALTLLVALAAVLLLLGGLGTPAYVRSRSRTRRFGFIRTGSTAKGAHAAWLELTHTAADLGLAPRATDTTRSRVRSWMEHFALGEQAQAAARRVQRREEVAQYAANETANPAHAASPHQDLARDVKTVSAAMRAQSTRRRRWRAKLLPRHWRQ